MEQQDEQLRLHIRKEARTNFIINVLLNGTIAYFLMRGSSQLSLQGEHGYGMDLVITALLLTGILSVIFIIMHRNKRQKGELPALPAPSILAMFPMNPWLCAVMLAVLAVLTTVPLLVAVLNMLGMSTLSPIAYAVVKAIWAGLLSVPVVIAAIRLGIRPAA